MLDISMPGYVRRQLLKYKHVTSSRPQHCPYSPEPKKYGLEAQAPLSIDTSRQLDMTVLMALSTIASKQMKGTEQTMEKALQVLDYLTTHPNAMIHFHATDMVMNIHSDASYLSAPNSRSRACGHFFLGWLPVNGEPICLNRVFHTLCSILQFVVASAAKAE